MKKTQKIQKRIALHGGAYTMAVTAVVLAILVAGNVLVSALPSKLTKFDISSSKLYSVTSNTKVVVNGLDQDVTIYWIVQAGKEDKVLDNLLDNYKNLSDHIQVVKKNPDVYPSFAKQYTDETVQNNSLVVECGDRNKYISYNDIYVQESNMYSYNYNVSFDGEGAITSGIDYVTDAEQPQMYVLEGHGEADLPETFKDQLNKENIETHSFSLLNEDQIPEDADFVMIYAPSSDISEEEEKLLTDYASNGGKLLVMAGPSKSGTLTNLYGLLKDYGVTADDGIVVEGDREHYAFQSPFVLLPNIESDKLTDSLIDANYFVIMPLAQGMKIGESGSKGTVTPILTTSDNSFSKADGYNLTTYEHEDQDTDGPYAVGLSIETDGGGQIIWFSSSTFLEDMYNAYSSGANDDLAMNAVSSLVGEREAMAIRSKSLNYNYLTISDSTASLLKVLMIGVFPLVYLTAGIYIVMRRRRLQR